MSRHSRDTAGPRSPALDAIIDALDEHDRKDRPGESRALRDLAELARKHVPARGVFAPSEGELQLAIDRIAKTHLGLEMPHKAFLTATAKVPSFEERDEIRTLVNHWMQVSEQSYFYAGLAFGLTFLQFDGGRRSPRRSSDWSPR